MDYVLNTIGASGIRFFNLSYNEGQGCKVIAAHSKYEAIGYYLMELECQIFSSDLDQPVMLTIDYIAEVQSNGEFQSKRLKEIYADQDDWILPKALANVKL